MGALKPVHIIIIVVAFMLLFGFKRLPDAARSLGRSMRIFKSEVDEMKSEHEQSKAARATVEGEKVERSADEATEKATPPVVDRTDTSA